MLKYKNSSVNTFHLSFKREGFKVFVILLHLSLHMMMFKSRINARYKAKSGVWWQNEVVLLYMGTLSFVNTLATSLIIYEKWSFCNRSLTPYLAICPAHPRKKQVPCSTVHPFRFVIPLILHIFIIFFIIIISSTWSFHLQATVSKWMKCIMLKLVIQLFRIYTYSICWC